MTAVNDFDITVVPPETETDTPTPVVAAPVSVASDLELLEAEAEARRARVGARLSALEAGVADKVHELGDAADDLKALPHRHAWWLVAGATAAGLYFGRRSTRPKARSASPTLKSLIVGTVVRAAVGHAVERLTAGPEEAQIPEDTGFSPEDFEG